MAGQNFCQPILEKFTFGSSSYLLVLFNLFPTPAVFTDRQEIFLSLENLKAPIVPDKNQNTIFALAQKSSGSLKLYKYRRLWR